MSWFDTSGLASIAKSALKEAQKTIDKALDIKDEINNVAGPIDTNSEDFFGTWGVAQINENKGEREQETITKSPVRSKPVASSLWGSFTGSFFEAAKDMRNESDSLDDSVDIGNEHFSGSKLVVQHSDEISTEFENVDITNEGDSKDKKQQDSLNPKGAKKTNRLSVVSSESGKNSSESVEILSGGTDCTTSPDTDVISPSFSVSSSSSTQGLKQTSESVEVLPDSLISPSSLEILDSESGSQKHTGEFVSPLQSPESLSFDVEKQSIGSVDVLPEEQEESSIAEDTSYTSASETTSTTVLDALHHHSRPQNLLKDALTRHENLNDSLVFDVSLSPEKTVSFQEPITRAPSRSAMILPINPILIDTQPQSTTQDLSSLIKNPNIIDIPQENESFNSSLSETQSNDEGSQSDRTLVANDNVMESSSDTSTTESNSNSTYLRNLLADAMTEKSSESGLNSDHFIDLTQSMINSNQESCIKLLENISISQLEMPQRDNSPLSSESRSDLVKLGSDHTSGHTSADEIETTTSSDIEIISSPNGDSSSTQSRQSPAKQTNTRCCKSEANVDVLLGKMTFQKIKGHNRELSEASSVSDDCHSVELDRLIKRVSEITEILEIREAKLVEINRRNVELQEMNGDLRKQLDSLLIKQFESPDVSQVTEEYTQRLSALEKKFQQTIREKDQLRKQLEQSKLDASLRISKGEVESLTEEKNQIIKELREEGEKLSKQQLQHSNIIKKLRAKEKDQETTIKNLKETVEDLSSETERLKRSLSAKDDVERSQIEAIHQLTAKNKKLEKEIMQMQSQLDDLTERYDTVKRSHEAAKKELLDKNKTSSELLAREQMLESLENEKRMTESQNEQIINELDDLRQKLKDANQECVRKEQGYRMENGVLLRRLEDAERRNEELSQSVLEVSRPLVRQLETLQATYSMKTASFEKIEEGLTLKISELQGRLKTVQENEILTREECLDLRAKLVEVENKLDSVVHENEMLKVEMDQRLTENMISEQELKKEIDRLEQQIKAEVSKIETLNGELYLLQQELMAERKINENGRRKQREQPQEGSSEQQNKPTPPETRTTSPTISMDRASLSESLSSTFWSPDDQFELHAAPRYSNMYEMQVLQTNLKQREGEVQQLQWELNRREHERTLLNAEISSLITKVEGLEAKVVDHDKLTKQFTDVQQQYDTLCQLFGEKVEENEELKLDLLDVKDMYKSQIDELLKQQKEKS